jgi:hypothetical protein
MSSRDSAISLADPAQRQARKLAVVAAAIAIMFALFCVAGILLRYTPLPYADDWGEYVGFNLDVLQGHIGAFWELDDAHRLVLPRLLNFLDFRFFGARKIFLIAADMALRLGILLALLAYARNQLKGAAFDIFALLACILAFAWLQAPNFYMGWDGAVSFLAMIFPLLGFYWLHRAREDAFWFAPALLAGFASVWTMANGLFVLPIMAAMSAVIGLGPRRAAILFLVFVATGVLYFWGFQYPEQPRPTPVEFVLFMTTYLGSAFYYALAYWFAGLQHLDAFVFGHGAFLVSGTFQDYPASRMAGAAAAAIGGAIFIVATLIAAWRWWRWRRTDSCQAALLAFIGFVVVSGALTALGRAAKGFDYALQERYTTGTMLAWQALAILFLAPLGTRKALRSLAIMIAVVPVALLPNQLRAVLKPDVDEQVAARNSLQAITSGQSDDPDVDRQVKRLKAMGIQWPR